MLISELWDTFGTVDGKLVRTVALLLARPGALTAEWLRGRRAPYISPLQLYLTVSAAFFAVLVATQPLVYPASERSIAVAQYADARRKLEARAATHSGPRAVLMRGLARASAEPADTRRAVVQALPRIMFVLVPLFALLLGRAYRNRGLRYPAHLYFSLHAFAFTFATWTVLRSAHAYGPWWVYAPLNVIANVAVPVYLVAAMRRVYGGRLWTVVGRAALLAALFFAAFLAVALAFITVRLGLA